MYKSFDTFVCPIGNTIKMFNHKTLSPMKKTVILISACLIAAVAFSQVLTASTAKPAAPKSLAAFKWAATSFDFGQVKKDVPVTHEFTFVNTGSEPLVITSVQATCGCTVTAFSKDAIPFGGTGYVKATYNAAAVGMFTKNITV